MISSGVTTSTSGVGCSVSTAVSTVAIEAVNDPPALDLDSDDPSMTGFAASFREGDGPVVLTGVVDIQDLSGVILNWGCTDPPGPCPGDVAGPGGTGPDGMVDISDLTGVILNWGPCSRQVIVVDHVIESVDRSVDPNGRR